MLILITGGAYQGKSTCAKKLVEKYVSSGETELLASGQSPAAGKNWELIENIHLLVRECLQENRDPYEKIEHLIGRYSDVILTVTELGCGIVPVDPFDRKWRETTGRVCCKLAGQADEVYRVTCGIPTRIK